MEAGARPNRIGTGILFMVLACALFSTMAAFGRDATERYHFMEVTFFRCFLAMVPVVAIGLGSSGLSSLRVKNWWLLATLGVLMTATLCTYFISIHLLPLNDAIVLSFTNAPFMSLLSGPFLKEKVTPQRWAAVISRISSARARLISWIKRLTLPKLLLNLA